MILRGRRSKQQAGGSLDGLQQAKQARESQEDVEVVQLQSHPNTGSEPATDQQGNANQTQQGPTSSSNVIDFQRIFQESDCPKTSQLQSGPLQSGPSNSNESVPAMDSFGNGRPLQS